MDLIQSLRQTIIEKQEQKALQEQPLQELSKKLLGNYVKKAKTDMATNMYAYGQDTDKNRKAHHNALRRNDNINKAVNRLTKEEEQFDEAKVFDPFTKKMVSRKSIKVKMGGPTTNNNKGFTPMVKNKDGVYERPSKE